MQSYVFENCNDQAIASRHFEERMAETRKRIYKQVFRMLGNHADAEDVTQETLVRAWSARASYDPARSFDAWILRIAANLCIDRIRRRKRRSEVSLETGLGAEPDGERSDLEIADLSQNPERLLLAKEIDAGLQHEIRSLPAVHRDCLLLLEQEYSYAEIAARMNCPVGTVRSRVHRARTHLSRAMVS